MKRKRGVMGGKKGMEKFGYHQEEDARVTRRGEKKGMKSRNSVHWAAWHMGKPKSERKAGKV